jgi:hypothetical protein
MFNAFVGKKNLNVIKMHGTTIKIKKNCLNILSKNNGI